MPWSPSDATGKTKKAKPAGQKKEWARVANAVLKKSGDEGKAIRIANNIITHKPKTIMG